MPVPLGNNFDLDGRSILKKISPQTKAIIINTPHNPTGQIFSLIQLKKLALGLKNKNVSVVFDGIYDDLIFEKEKNTTAKRLIFLKKIILF